MPYTLGLDIGTNSIGWSLIRRSERGEPTGVIALGSRIFSDGREAKTKTSLAVARREKRGMRRRRDRYLRRRQAMLNLLIDFDLLPKDKAERKALELVNPYLARAAALDGSIPPHQIGRVLFHLNQRRGFKSNRKTDKGDEESGKIALATSKLRFAMTEAGARTFGEFLAGRLKAGLPLRVRMTEGEGPLKKDDSPMEGYAFYPDRALLEDEFRAIWNVQVGHHPGLLTTERFEALYDCVFFQRPLKRPEVGRCMLVPAERRIAKSDPLFQERRLLEELNALKIEYGPGVEPERLTADQRDKLLMEMHGKRAVAFTSLRKRLKLGDAVFNKERGGRDKLLGDEVFAELSHKDRFGPEWSDVPLERQREIVAKLRDEEDGESLVAWLMAKCGLDEARARKVAGAHLPEGYGRLGETATRVLIRELKAAGPDGRVIVYSEAVERAPELDHHSDFRTGEIMDRLPYYGEILAQHIVPGTGEPADDVEKRLGKLTNPTVHIGLNQLRRLVNGIIETYGHPDEVIVELARDLKASDDQKAEIQKRQAKDERDAIARGQKLIELNQPNTGANRALLKLWEELNPDPTDRRCIYTGELISPTMLFSGQVDVDHILPWSRTLDDSNANRLVCLVDANREKRNRTPYEIWGEGPKWDAILQRAAKLPKNKAWRFNPDAMKKFGDEAGFLSRHLVDTQYLSRMAKQYLEAIAPDRVWVSVGRLTAMLRRHWGLNSLLPDHNYAKTVHEKNRTDHRHHAIDAAVIAVLNLSLIQKVAREAGRREEQGIRDVIDTVGEPWPGFREHLGEAVNRIIVSHRPDHGMGRGSSAKRSQQTAGGLHNDTAYGLTGEVDPKGASLVVRRVPLSALKPSHLEDSGARVRDDHLRRLLREATLGLVSTKDFEAAVQRLAREHKDFRGMRRVRVIEPLSVIAIRDGEGRAYKGYKGDANYRYDVWQMPDGKWKADVISMFDAHQPQDEKNPRRPHPAARKVMSLHQDDMVKYEDDERGDGIGRVVKFDQSGSIYIAPHNEAGSLKARDAKPDEEDPFRYFKAAASRLKRAKVRQVRIDELGRVWDPGFRE